MAVERIEVDGQIYRKVALTKIEEADAPRGPQEPTPADWFFGWIPESRFGVEHAQAPVGEIMEQHNA